MLLAAPGLSSQNLVQNPGFQTNSSCPVSLSQIARATPWVQPTTGTPDYFNGCTASTFIDVPGNAFGYQMGRSGTNAYAGIYVYTASMPDYREYIQQQLLSPLIAGTNYLVEAWVNLGDSCNLSSDDIGFYFSASAITRADNLPFSCCTPQVSNASGNYIGNIGWTQISGYYLASGGEQYITIGNFKDDANTTLSTGPGPYYFDRAYYYIDDVSVTGAALPAEWTELSVRALGQAAEVLWTTASENNNDFFTVERSTDGIDFAEAGKVPGVGNSMSPQHYSFIDDFQSPHHYITTSSHYYYRIRQTDRDGRSAHSKTVILNTPASGLHIAVPRLCGDMLNLDVIRVSGSALDITVLGLAGNVLMNMTEQGVNGTGIIRVDVGGLSPGMYLLSIKDGKEIVQSRFIK